MSVITISRGSFTHGAQVAEEVAGRLGYRCLSREVLLEASQHFNVPEASLVHAVDHAPSFLDRMTSGPQRYLAYIRCALLAELKKDNVVYQGFAGHFFVSDVAHVLKVRVESEMEERVRARMARDNVSAAQARASIERNDRERRRWSERLYHIDGRDSLLYDLMLRVGRLTVRNTVDIICDTVQLEQFRTTPESQQMMEDLALAAEVQSALSDLTCDVKVVATRGAVVVRTLPAVVQLADFARHLEHRAQSVPGVGSVKIEGCLRIQR